MSLSLPASTSGRFGGSTGPRPGRRQLWELVSPPFDLRSIWGEYRPQAGEGGAEAVPHIEHGLPSRTLHPLRHACGVPPPPTLASLARGGDSCGSLSLPPSTSGRFGGSTGPRPGRGELRQSRTSSTACRRALCTPSVTSPNTRFAREGRRQRPHFRIRLAFIAWTVLALMSSTVTKAWGLSVLMIPRTSL